MFPEEEGTPSRVRAVYDSEGGFVGFQNPDQRNRFISRTEAISLLRYDRNEQSIIDSFGNKVGVGSLALPGRGEEVAYTLKVATYNRLEADPTTFKPRANQEILERIVVVDKDGKLVKYETSYGLGKNYATDTRGGWWRQKVSNALGLKPNERIPTKDLSRAVVRRDFILKEIN